ncbi:hypothetical protein U1Q18_025716 [Sarracenia purpurea var. burkii]
MICFLPLSQFTLEALQFIDSAVYYRIRAEASSFKYIGISISPNASLGWKMLNSSNWWCLFTGFSLFKVEEKVERDRSKPENGPVAQQNGAGEDGVGREVSSYKFRSPDSFSESGSVVQSASTTDQDSEADWLHSGTVNRSPECSDVDSISDEESQKI